MQSKERGRRGGEDTELGDLGPILGCTNQYLAMGKSKLTSLGLLFDK